MTRENKLLSQSQLLTAMTHRGVHCWVRPRDYPHRLPGAGLDPSVKTSLSRFICCQWLGRIRWLLLRGASVVAPLLMVPYQIAIWNQGLWPHF